MISNIEKPRCFTFKVQIFLASLNKLEDLATSGLHPHVMRMLGMEECRPLQLSTLPTTPDCP